MSAEGRTRTMTKGELIEHVEHQYPHYTGAVEKIVNAVLERVSVALAQGERVELRGFGSFAVRERPSRAGRNPRTGAPVRVAAKRLAIFKAAKELCQRVEGQDRTSEGGGARPEGYEGERPRAALAGHAESDV
jgi:integration host factor subunit beta